MTRLLTFSPRSKFIEETVGDILKMLRGLPKCTSHHYLADVSKGKETSETNPKKKAKHGARSPHVLTFFDNKGTFIKNSHLDSLLVNNEIYRQLTPPARISCRVIQKTSFEWEYSPPSGSNHPWRAKRVCLLVLFIWVQTI